MKMRCNRFVTEMVLLLATTSFLAAQPAQVVVEKKVSAAPNGNELALAINMDGMTRATRFVRVDGRVKLVSAEKAVAIKPAQSAGTAVAVK